MPYYAELNKEDIVSGISDLSGVVNDHKLIEIESMDHSLRGKKYDRETKTFIGQPKPEPPPLRPSPIEQIQEDQGAMMMGLIDLYVQQQKTESNRVQDADAVMMGMMDLYTQNAELKAELAAIKAKLEGGA